MHSTALTFLTRSPRGGVWLTKSRFTHTCIEKSGVCMRCMRPQGQGKDEAQKKINNGVRVTPPVTRTRSCACCCASVMPRSAARSRISRAAAAADSASLKCGGSASVRSAFSCAHSAGAHICVGVGVRAQRVQRRARCTCTPTFPHTQTHTHTHTPDEARTEGTVQGGVAWASTHARCAELQGQKCCHDRCGIRELQGKSTFAARSCRTDAARAHLFQFAQHTLQHQQ